MHCYYNNCVNLRYTIDFVLSLYMSRGQKKEWMVVVVCKNRETIKKNYILIKFSVK